MTVVGVGDFAVAMNPRQWVKTCVVVLAMAATLMAQTARPNRIAQGATAGGMATVKGTVHPLAKQATDLGAVNSQIKMESLTLNTNLSAAQQKDLDTLLAAQQNPKSSLYSSLADAGAVWRALWIDRCGPEVRDELADLAGLHGDGRFEITQLDSLQRAGVAGRVCVPHADAQDATERPRTYCEHI